MSETDLVGSQSDSDAPAAPRRRGGLSGMVLAELRQLATELNVPDISGMRKGDLIAAIKERQGDSAPAKRSTRPSPRSATGDGATPDAPQLAFGDAGSDGASSNGSAAGSSANGNTDTAQATAPAGTDGSADATSAPAAPSRRRRAASRPAGAPDASRDAEQAAPESNGAQADAATDTAAPPSTPDVTDTATSGQDASAQSGSESSESGGDGGSRRGRTRRRSGGGGDDRPAQNAPQNSGQNSGQSSAQNDERAEQSAGVAADAGGKGDGQDGDRSERRGRDNQGRGGNQGNRNGRDGNGGRDNNGRGDSRNDNRGDSRNDGRGDNRGDGRNDGRNDNRNDNRGNNESRGNNDRNGNDRGDDQDDDGDGRGRRGRRFRDRRRGRDRERGGSSTGGGNVDTEIRDDDVLLPVAGIVDILDNYAFVRTTGYLSGPTDVYVSMSMVRKNGLRRGDAITGAVRQPREGEQQRQKFNPLVRVDTINGRDPETARQRSEFTKLTPLYPNERLRLETDPSMLTTRVIDLVMPVGKGQRALIVSPPKAGKTTIMQNIANAITTNNPECHLMVVLVDERPEEVTDMQRSVKGEVIASTFDRPPSDHTTVAELSIERAKRLVEMGHDVVVLLDNITRLGRAYNLAAPASGRILSGGVDSTALYPPKRFLGAARNIEDGGSLTIFATALVETGSTMDTVIFEEFKGTGNAELKLDRKIADKRVFPAIDIGDSGTRKDELLMSPDEHAVMVKLRRVLSALDDQQAIDLVLTQLKKNKTNIEFLMQVSKNAAGALTEE